MQTSEGITSLSVLMLCSVSCATVSRLEMMPLKEVSEKTLKMHQKMVSSRPGIVTGAISPKPNVLRLTNA